MGLNPGARLGSYEIVALLGAGGMGEVYRARDTQLEREVAIKILPEVFASDPERRARFEREAKVLAALNHPNIAVIYGLEQNALVMELVEGERLLQSPLTMPAALDLARQIAEALEAAHEKGTVHRDLKPANVMVTPAGVVKVLDFGLAAVLPGSPGSSSDLANSPTLTMAATQAGAVLGTAAYMSPEQASGKPVDKRADIWSFGVLLFEMLTGTQLFAGETISHTLADVLRAPIDLERLPKQTPPAVRELLRRCLDRDVLSRLRDIGEARVALSRLGSEPVVEVATAPRPRFWWAAWGLAGVMAIVAAAATWGWLDARTGALGPEPYTLTFVPPKEEPAEKRFRSVPLISPDGKWLRIGPYLKRMDSLTVLEPTGFRSLLGSMFWSADSRWFMAAGRELRRMRVPDGALEVVAKAYRIHRGGTQAEDGTVLIYSTAEGLRVLSPGSSAFQPLVVPEWKDGHCYNPEFLPGGEDFIVSFRREGAPTAEIYLATLKMGKVSGVIRLMQNETSPHYTPAGGGVLLFVRNDNLFSQKLNLKDRRLEGDSYLIQRGVHSAPDIVQAHFTVSRSGLLVWRPGIAAREVVTVFDRQGKVLGTSGQPGSYFGLRLSPDGTRLLAISQDRWPQLLEPGRGGMLEMAGATWTTWSADGLSLIGHNGRRILKRTVVGRGDARPVSEAEAVGWLDDVSPDGTLALMRSGSDTTAVFRLGGAKSGDPAPSAPPGVGILNHRFSPDGRWIVFDQASGVWVQPFPGPGMRRQIVENGQFPVWRRDGKEIVCFRRDSDALWSIPVSGSESDLRFGTPAKLFEVRMPSTVVPGVNPLEVSPDGSRIYLPQSVPQPEDSSLIHVRSGWWR